MSEWRVFIAELRGPRSDAAVPDDEFDELGDPEAIADRTIPKGVEVYEIDGPFFFGAAEKFKDTLAEVFAKPKVLIIRMRRVPAIDSTGLNVLRDLVNRTRKDRTLVILAEPQEQPRNAIRRSGLLDEIGPENVCPSIDLALATAQQYLTERRPATPRD